MESLKILWFKAFNNYDILSLQRESGEIITIPREWTDKADPNPYDSLLGSLPLLSFIHLQQLADLISTLDQSHSQEAHLRA